EGVPIIISHGVAISQEIANVSAGILVETGPEDIARAVKRLIDNPAELAPMRVAARRLAREKFSVDGMGDRLLALYSGLVNPAVLTQATFISAVTPMILTYNEELNIERTLSKLTWAERILVVDSGSTDGTLDVIRRFPQAEVVHRNFDTAAQQANF